MAVGDFRASPSPIAAGRASLPLSSHPGKSSGFSTAEGQNARHQRWRMIIESEDVLWGGGGHSRAQLVNPARPFWLGMLVKHR